MGYGGWGLLNDMQANRTADAAAAVGPRLPYRTLLGVGFCVLFMLIL